MKCNPVRIHAPVQVCWLKLNECERRSQVAAEGGSAPLLPNARHAGEGAERRNEVAGTMAIIAEGANALRTTRSTPKKIQKCLAMPWRTEEKALVESLL
jgi:hypothetical protein